jgi:hypothetical protein
VDERSSIVVKSQDLVRFYRTQNAMEQIRAQEYAIRYLASLGDILKAFPKNAILPAHFKKMAFLICYEDSHRKISLELISRKNPFEIEVNGKRLSAELMSHPQIVVPGELGQIEDFLFPQDDKGTSASFSVNERYVVLNGLAFANKEYADKYWKDAKFYRNTSGSIPFSVGPSGSMLGLNLLWGAELAGRRRERLFEFIKIYGDLDMIPSNEREFVDEVFRDFIHASSEIQKISNNWSFSNFLSELQGPVDQNVLLLGSYKSEEDFDKLRTALGAFGYSAFLLKDSPDLPIQTNLEKLITAIICSSFVIVIDKEASGHIAELETMLQYNFRPVIVLREEPHPTTAFLEDRILMNDCFKIAVLQDITPSTLLPYIKWAREISDSQIKALNRINKWRA